MTRSQDEHIYQRILELPQEVTHPDAYQLLGLQRFESDPKTIKTAAMDRNARLQRMQNAENYDSVKRLEREVGDALVCLMNPQSKAEYDQKLTQTVALIKAPPPASGERAKDSYAERHESKVAGTSLPGEIPWQLKDHWWNTHPVLAKGVGISAGVLLFLILIVSIWPS